ncbi:MAG: hypothetical protein R2747_00440 [Pyrinomonadaceae bacterium]
MILFLQPDLMPLVKTFVILFLMLFVAGVAVTTAAWFGLRFFARYLNTRRDTWEATARLLGLEINREYRRPIKPLEGVYQDLRVKIFHESVPKNRGRSFDLYTVCEVHLRPEAFGFPFEVRCEDSIIQGIARFIGKGDVEIGLPGFDKSFYVDCPDAEAVRCLLSADQPDGQTVNLAADLMLFRKSYWDVRIADDLVCLKLDGEFFEVAKIRPMLDDAVYLAERMRAARKKLSSLSTV